MGTANLTEITVRGLKGSERYETTFDTNLPAFGVRCGRRSKTFVVVRGRGRERITLGHWPTMSVGDARAKAKKLLANDDEPKAARRGFRETREEFLETHYAGKADSTKYQVTRAFARHCGTLEGMQLAAIGDADIKRALDKLSDRPSEQLHLFRYLRTFFRWCQRSPRRYVKHSPMEGYEAPGRDRRKTRILSDDEIKAVWQASAKPQEAVVRLMLLWGTRRTETCVLERSWVAHQVLTIPGVATVLADELFATRLTAPPGHIAQLCQIMPHLGPATRQAGLSLVEDWIATLDWSPSEPSLMEAAKPWVGARGSKLPPSAWSAKPRVALSLWASADCGAASPVERTDSPLTAFGRQS